MMDLLQKFAAVEVQADNRISENDKFYCEQHQSAYETAISNYKELAFFWADMEAAQKEFVGEKSDNSFYHNYLASRNGPTISKESIEKHIASLHTDFIMTLTRYFNSCYHVTVSSSEICEALLPKEPDRYSTNRETLEEYHNQMQNMTVQYQDVVDQIILRLDGRSFADQAFHELSAKCHEAAWNKYDQTARFEQKKDTIRFSGYFCQYETFIHACWKLDEKLKEILRGAAHFETGCYNVYPLRFSDLLTSWQVETDLIEFPTCEKLRQLKMFKNGRADLKFVSAELAGEFITKYLGLVI